MKISEYFFSEEDKDFNIPLSEDFTPQLVLVFGSTKVIKSPDFYNTIKSSFPQSHSIFLSTSGQIYKDEVQEEGASITAISFEKTPLEFSQVSIEDMEASFEVGKKAATQLSRKDLKHVLIFSDGLKVNGSELIKGAKEVLGDTITLSGGLAGDGEKFSETFTALDAYGTSQKNVIFVGLYGDNIQIGTGSLGGWDIFGPKRRVTKSKGNTVYELDGKPVLDLYKLYLGELSEKLPASGVLFPLSINSPDSDTDIVRTLLSIDETEKSITFAGDIPEGHYAQLMKANFERLIEGANGALDYALQKNKNPSIALLVSCVGRKLVLKQRIHEEIEIIRKTLGDSCSIAGFYSYGEIGPYQGDSDDCQLHNQTMTITLLSEK